jgi:DNA-binding transcriptional ArsR family regulator
MTENVPERRRIDDPEVLKGLAQPIRQRLYRLLSQIGPATGSTLAKRVNGDPGLISYHLRELARRGFIEDVPALARDRRERWWQTVPGSTTWSWSDFPSPEGQAIASAVKGQMVADEFARLRRYEQHREGWSEAWQEAATSSDSFMRLTPDELRQLSAELLEVVERWGGYSRERDRDRQTQRAADGEGREHVFLFLHAFPDRP